MLGIGAAEEMVHGLAEKEEPAVKLGATHFGLRRQFGMRSHGIAGVAAGAEEHGLPKGIHAGQVSVPVDPGNFIEDETQKLVLPHDLVKAIHKPLDIRAPLQVCEFGLAMFM